MSLFDENGEWRAERAGGEMAAAQDGGAPRDPARVAQFGRAAGAPSAGPRPPRAPPRGSAPRGRGPASVLHL